MNTAILRWTKGKEWWGHHWISVKHSLQSLQEKRLNDRNHNDIIQRPSDRSIVFP